jgi:DNA polymerase-1
MALRGDSVDNIPGAPGIGEKGSVELIRQFGTVEAALDRASEVKRKSYRESLENNRGAVLMSKELVTIHCSVPIELDLSAMETQEPDLAASRALFSELEFTTLLKELGSDPVVSAQQRVVEYVEQPTAAQIARVIEDARHGALSFVLLHNPAAVLAESAVRDGDTTEIEDAPASRQSGDLFAPSASAAAAAKPAESLLPAAISSGDGTILQVDLQSKLGGPVRAALADGSLPKRVHDLKSMLRVLGDANIPLVSANDDLMLYSYLINPTHASHTLADIAARFDNAPFSKPEQAADLVARLTPQLAQEVNAADLRDVYEKIDLPLSPVLMRMERAGIRVDLDVLGDLARRINADMAVLSERIYECCGHRFNINSPKQLGDVLFNKMGLPKPLKYGKGKVVSTAQDVMEELSQHHEAPRMVLEFRYLAKLKSNYVDALPLLADPVTHRVHTTFNQVGTATGRLSSVQPNLQNIPVRTALGREIRSAFIAAPGNVILAADYSQIELRLLAHFSEDPRLLAAYREGTDIHTLTAAEIFEIDPATMDKQTRDRAKAINFGIVYGISAFGLAQQNIGINQHEARMYIERYFERYAGVRAFVDRTVAETRSTQRVRTIFGRTRPIPDIGSSNPNMRGFAERTAVNTPLQGTAADLIKLAMIRIDAELSKRGLATQMTLQVHDELLFDVPGAEIEEVRELVRSEMENVYPLKVPLIADIGAGPNWRDLD